MKFIYGFLKVALVTLFFCQLFNAYINLNQFRSKGQAKFFSEKKKD
jgi:hypothetical protein